MRSVARVPTWLILTQERLGCPSLSNLEKHKKEQALE